MEMHAIQQRQALPKIIQMLYPLPVSSGIKAKHVQEINKKILSDEFIEKHPLLKDLIPGGKQTYLDAIIAKNRHDRYTTIDNENSFLMEIRKI